MRLIKYISIFFLAAFFMAAGLSCSNDKPDPGWNDKDDYVTVLLTIGGTVYYDAGGTEPIKVEGLKVGIAGTSGVTTTNQHGYFIINTSKNINKSDVDEYVVIQVVDMDGSAGGGHFGRKNVTLNIGRLVEWNVGAGAFVVRNDPSKLNIFVEKSLE